MNEQYFGLKVVNTFNPSFWFMLKLKIFGKRIDEYHGGIYATWYLYKNVLYFTNYSAFYK